MLKQDLKPLYESLEKVSGKKGVKFAYAVAKNKKLLKDEIDAIEEAKKVDKYTEFEIKWNQLKLEYCDKDKTGNPKIESWRIFFNGLSKKKADEYKNKWEELEKEYEWAIKEFQEKEKEVQDILKEEIKIELHKVKEEDLPEDLSASELEGIFEIIA